MDLKSYSRWYDYSRARDAMFAGDRHGLGARGTSPSSDKRRARLNIITHLLDKIPYERLTTREVKLPRRQSPGGYVEATLSLRRIPEPF